MSHYNTEVKVIFETKTNVSPFHSSSFEKYTS